MWLDTTGGAEGAQCVVENAVDPFNALGKGVKVKATLQANNWDATRTSLAGGAGPDVIGTPGSVVRDAACPSGATRSA